MIGSVTGKTSRASEAISTSGAASEGASIYDASVVSDGRKDSAEELRREMLRQEQIGFGGLENVRACCDGKSTRLSNSSVTNPKHLGKHDVSTLTHAHRHGSSSGHMHRGVSMSMSLRGSARRSGVVSSSAAQTPTKAAAP